AVRGNAALIVTSPPYGSSVHGLVRPGPSGIHKTAYTYTDSGRHRANLAHAGWNGLIEGMTRILTGCRLLLRPGGIVAVTARPVRRHGTLMDLPSAVLTAGVAAGLTPVERCVALLAAWRDGRLVARPSFFQLQQLRNARRAGLPLHLIAHEDVLVLRHDDSSGSSCEPKCS